MGEDEIDLKEFIYLFWRKKIIIVLITLLFAYLGYWYTYNYKTPMYQASTTLLLAQNYSEESQGEINEITQTDIALNQKLVSTYSVLVKSNNVINQVLENLNMNKEIEEELKDNIQVKAISNTQVIEISYMNKEPKTAYKVANELANVFCVKVKEFYNINNVYIVDKAKTPVEPYNVNHVKDIITFASAGLVISCISVFLFSLIDTTVRNSEKVEKATGLTVLAQLPEIKVGRKG